MEISLIAAMDRNQLIGAEGEIPWHLPADLRYFKMRTMGKPLIMGRKTYESIGKALPGRHNIVLTRHPGYAAPGCTVVHSVPTALAAARPAAEVMVIGGHSIYAALLPEADRLYLTYIDAVFAGDTFFPPFAEDAWQVMWEEDHAPDAQNPYPYRFVILEREGTVDPAN